ncbi:MAG: methylmalonyl-CoA epimerase [Deltaproteobacteria bacterium]|nr:methylmalonyl-CoA epimerase [Deltaproteobacteria bacterium]
MPAEPATPATPAGQLRVEAIDHIAIVTADLEASLALWEKALGIRCQHVEELPARGIKVAMLPVGDTRIELVAPLHDQSEVSAFLDKKGGGIHHLALRVADVDAGVTELKQKGVRIAQEPAPGAHGCRVAFVHPKSTGGVLLELSTPSGSKP